MFEKLVKIFAFDRRPLNFGLKFELVWEPRRNLFGGLLNVLREADFHSVSWQGKNVTMQGREAKHVQIASYAKKQSFQGPPT